ncbi:unnamed protein product [Arctia plantaginis]|uniref:Uncharacterized protein n=1 Tax=Arctia plantaginis TaxID=874455 RepID=A0A8S1BFV7_ARCPL|nr:unnamed protein product [Arctia plantaginis]
MEADNLNSLLEQFEAMTSVREPTINLNNLLKIEMRQISTIPVLESNDLKSFIEKVEAIEKVKTQKRSEPVINVKDSKENIPIQNYCLFKNRHNDLKKTQKLSKPEVTIATNIEKLKPSKKSSQDSETIGTGHQC